MLELQWELDGEDDAMSWMLDLHAIVDAPGPTHSAYKCQRLDRFPATTLEEREHAHASAQRLASNLGVPLEAPDVHAHGGQGGSRWIERAPVGALYGYPLRWTACWWTDFAEQREASGRETMYATSGQAAARLLVDELARRLAGGALRIFVEGDDDTHARHDVPPLYPAAAPPIDRVRALALTGPPSAIARALFLDTPFDLIVVFSLAFYWSYEQLVALATWYVDHDDDALDATLGPKLAETRPTWDRPRRLREAFAAGHNIAALLRSEVITDRMRIFMQLREIFDLSFADTKDFVGDLEDPRNDARLDAMLRLR
ncbi:MAG: hypothetical protein ABI678_09910 [Kofleriaceae bacterium]